MENNRVLLGLSGGADSAAAAILLRRAGYDVTAAVLDLSPASAGAVEAARACAAALDVPLRVLRDHGRFDRDVVAPFCAAYRAGRTPNPCVICNPTVKFALLCEEADRLGCAHVATGHWARLADVGGVPCVRRAACAARDQSYMLAALTKAQRERLLLPIGDLADKQIARSLGRAFALTASDAPDSQEICFVPGGDYPAFIDARLGAEPPGEYIAPDGTPCGTHTGVSRCTVGQRKGLGVALGRPVCVRRIDAETRRVTLAEADGVSARRVFLADMRWQTDPPASPAAFDVKIRSAALPARAVFSPTDMSLLFDTPVRAPAPGQTAVLYGGDVIRGCGVITDAEYGA